MSSFLAKFAVLRGAARELWLTFLLKFLIVAAYLVTTLTVVPWLERDFGFSDQRALAVVAAWSMVITAATLIVGPLTDALGLRRTYFLGVWICLAARAVMAFSTVKWIALAGGLFPLAIGEALGSPVLVAATRKYSTTAQRSISFSMIYAIMNVGYLAGEYIFDFLRKGLGETGHCTLPVFHWQLSTYRTVFLIACGIEILALIATWFIRPGVEATDEGIEFRPPNITATGHSIWKRSWQITRQGARETVEFFGLLVKQPGFYRLLTFLLLISFLKLISMHMNYIFPTWGIRELGAGAPVGRLWGINSYLVIVLVPIIGALTQRYSAYGMVIIGSIITAGSVFFMSLRPDLFQAAAESWFGNVVGHYYLGLNGVIHPYYAMITIYVIIFSVGEAFYSPRVYEYAAAIAPKGQEASYGALSYVPFLIGKFYVGLSGPLLARYCPATGPRQSGKLWFIVASLASIAPIGLLLLQRFIRARESGRSL